MSKLKNCPFCGSKAHMDSRESPHSLRGFYWVISCVECPAEMEAWHTDKDELVSDWNRRND